MMRKYSCVIFLQVTRQHNLCVIYLASSCTGQHSSVPLSMTNSEVVRKVGG